MIAFSQECIAEAKYNPPATNTQLHALRRVAFIPFITAGDPDLDTTAHALKRLDAAGATVIELGVPYSVG